MAYAASADIQAYISSAHWTPDSAEPDVSTVSAWLDEESSVVEGQIERVVTVPVVEATSPHLFAIVAQVVTLRLAARVVEFLYPNDDRPAAWRKLAEGMVTGIQRGAVADGVALAGGVDSPGAPSGNFPSTTSRDWMGRRF